MKQLLICSGLDPSGGAGFIADVQLAARFDVRPVGIVTATTIQNTLGVAGWQPVSAEHVREQLEHLLSDVEVAAVKLGMLGAVDTAVAIGHALQLTKAPVVWDPVLFASRGTPLVDGELAHAIAAIEPHLTVVTPNARELAILSGTPVIDLDEAVAAGEALAARLGAAVLVKGGHLATGDESIDVLIHKGSREELRASRIPGGEDVHGTGCALATVIAAQLAHGVELIDACREAKRFVGDAITLAVRPGRGAPAVV
ncbi:MAG TPA: bifunctional hydroxymethylpyrimidine kinase/phosphomethylpyrimidine kinase [Kofleriaceae bacterium]